MHKGDERHNVQDTDKGSIIFVCIYFIPLSILLRQILEKPKKTRGRWIRACNSVKGKQWKK